MSAVKQAAANTVLRIANLFEQNCALKHGLPKVGGPDRIDAEEDEPKQSDPLADIAMVAVGKLGNSSPAATPATSSPSPGGGVAQQSESSLLGRAAPYLLAALGLAGAGGLGYVLAPSNETTIIEQTTPQATDGSLLQTLQDRGLHLPEGPWQTK